MSGSNCNEPPRRRKGEPPPPDERARRTVQRAAKKLAAAQLEIDLLTARSINIRRRLIPRLTKILSQVSLSTISNLVSELYWAFEETSGPVKRSFQNLKIGVFNAGAGLVQAACLRCGAGHTYQVKSWTDHNEKRSRYRRKGDSHRLLAPSYEYRFCESCYSLLTAAEGKESEEETDWQEYVHNLRSIPYSEYLKTEHWQGLRRKCLQRAGYRCQLCNGQGKLNVHHRTYERRGQEWLSDLIVLCEPCHQKHHDVLPTKPEHEEEADNGVDHE